MNASLTAYRDACQALELAEARVKAAADSRARAVWAMARDGLTFAQIADLLGCTRQNAHKLVCRARELGDAVVVADVAQTGHIITDDQLAAARAILPALRKRVRDEAAAARADSLRILQYADALSVTRPSDKSIGEWDWTRGLMPAELDRLGRTRELADGTGSWWSTSVANRVDDVAERLRAALPAMSGLGVDEIMGRVWLYHTRIVDAGSLVARGKLPIAKRYSGSIDVANLAPSIGADGYSVTALLGDDDSAARHVASVDAVREADECYRLLGDSVRAQYGPAPWRMSAESFTAELLSIAAQLEGTDELTSSRDELEARRDELVPKMLDDGSDWPTLHAAIVACATSAGMA
jgi:hypothetical protein